MPTVIDTDPQSPTWQQQITVTDAQLATMRSSGQSPNHGQPHTPTAAQQQQLSTSGPGYVFNGQTGQISLPASNAAENAAYWADQKKQTDTQNLMASARGVAQTGSANANNVIARTSQQANGLFGAGGQSPYTAPSITGAGGMQGGAAQGGPMQGAGMTAGPAAPSGLPMRGVTTSALSPQGLPSSMTGRAAPAGPGPTLNAQGSLSGVKQALATQAASAAPPAFQTGKTLPGVSGISGQLGAGPTVGSVANVNGQLAPVGQAKSVGSIAGKLGAAPTAAAVGGISGQLGAAPTVGSVGNVSGRLGAAPAPGQVGNIAGQLGSAPGAISGQLGTMGQSNANQSSMFGRVNSFLDAPDGPSVAQAQLQSAQADNMANLIGAARSGRGGAGASAQALRGAVSEGGAVASDTAGQMATLRAQEEDMRKNRQLSAIGLGGQIATDMRGQDLGYRGQDLSSLQSDQSTALGARGQNLGALSADQGTQLALQQLGVQAGLTSRGQDLSAMQGDQSTGLGLQQLQASTALGARGQNLSALQGDQSTAAQMSLGQLQAGTAARGQNLGALQSDQGTAAQMSLGNLQAQLTGRGQNLSALQGDQSTGLGLQQLQAQTALGTRGQNLSALQGDQSTQLGARGQDVATRGQDLTALMSDADRQVAVQDQNLRSQLGMTSLGLEAQGQGYNYLLGTQGQALGSEQLAQGAYQQQADRDMQSQIAQMQAANGQAIAGINNNRGIQTGDLERWGLGSAATAGGILLANSLGGKSSSTGDPASNVNVVNGAPIAPIEPYDRTKNYSDNPYL